MKFVGTAVSAGVVVGRTYLYERFVPEISALAAGDPVADAAHYAAARDAAQKELEELCRRFTEAQDPEKAAIFTAHLEILADETMDEEIRDGIRYVCSTPYGVEGGQKFLIYLPGAPVADLPEGFCNWVGTQLVDANNDRATELPFFGLYNVTTQEGFSAYPDDGEAAG